MNRFVAGDRAPSSPEGAKMLACTHPAFDGPVILFQDVIKILHRSMSTLLFQNLAGFELNDRWRISSVLVGVDDPRRGMVLPTQGFGSESARPPLHRVWPREGSRSSHRWSPRPGTSTPICLSPGRTSRPPAKSRLLP